MPSPRKNEPEADQPSSLAPVMAIMVGTTVDSNQEAQNIAAACVKSGIAACAHIDEIKSLFFWDGEVKDGVEYRVFLKTVDASYEAIADVINSQHSYDEPAIFCIPISRGSDTYIKWIEDNSTALSSKAPQDTPSLQGGVDVKVIKAERNGYTIL